MNPTPHTPSAAPNQQGFALLEAMISILIFSFGVLGILSIQAAMVKHTTDAKYRSEASYIAQQRIGQMWTNPTNAAAYLEQETDISTRLPSGTRTVTQPTAGEFVVTVTWQQPGQGTPEHPEQGIHTFTTTARIAGG